MPIELRIKLLIIHIQIRAAKLLLISQEGHDIKFLYISPVTAVKMS